MKRRRKLERAEEIEEEIENNVGEGHNYLIMEYLQLGSLANLIVKLNERQPEDDRLLKIPNRVLWGFWLCRKWPREIINDKGIHSS